MITPRSHVPYVPITSTDLDASVDFFDASVYGRCWGDLVIDAGGLIFGIAQKMAQPA
ncbi:MULTISPECIES: hypothetical protein [Bacteria]